MPTLSRRNFVLQSAAIAGIGVSTPSNVPRRIQSASGHPAQALEAGVAVADLTPPVGIPMWGYSNPEQVSAGTLDPLYGKALVLRVGEACIGLVSMDFGRMPPSRHCEAVRKKVRKSGINDVIFCATHTHSGPIMESPDLAHVEPIGDALADLLTEAAARLQPVRLGVGKAPLEIAHNRRVVKDGQCWMRWRNVEKLPSGPLDPELTALHLESLDGNALATLVHYACHPVILGPDNRKYSADWPGIMCRDVQRQTGAPCLFLQGAAGDINPFFDKMALSEGAVEAVSAEGGKAAQSVFAALKSLEWQAPAENALAFERSAVEVGLRYDLDNPDEIAIMKAAYARLYDFYLKDIDRRLPLPQDCLLLQNSVALIFQPGEPFIQFQLDLKARSTVPHSLLCGYANEFHIYFPTVEAAIIGGYGASVTTYAGIGAGEKLLAEGMAQIGRLTGRLHGLRGPEDFETRDWVPGI
jgi:hypothetical protein